ncbi:hypothetical protein [Brucella oryzae]|uniref:Uncharacterized protein n=1 Tax=Brucella oryzae TaxID=335286 RepID=A0A2S7IUC7_9HYPH|nr:hypothetical protein [Brucella oryzae]PQA71602.1 hypothetical protein C3731_21160 [Brucella oryzae]
MASEDLLKKAVTAFNALSPDQQAEMLEEQRQSWVRGNIGLSRDERGMTSPVMPRPAPAATDTGLETVGHIYFRTDNSMKRYLTDILKYNPDDLAFWINEKAQKEHTIHQLVTRSQAEELLAAERAKVRHWQEQYTEMHSQFIDLAKSAEADNAAQAARIKEWEKADRLVSAALWEKKVEALEAKLAAAEKALENAADDFYLIHTRISDGQVERAKGTAFAGEKATLKLLGGKP